MSCLRSSIEARMGIGTSESHETISCHDPWQPQPYNLITTEEAEHRRKMAVLERKGREGAKKILVFLCVLCVRSYGSGAAWGRSGAPPQPRRFRRLSRGRIHLDPFVRPVDDRVDRGRQRPPFPGKRILDAHRRLGHDGAIDDALL